MEIANIIKNYFSTVFTKDSGDCLPNLASFLDENECLSSINIFEQLVLKKLNIIKSPGPDYLHPRLLFELCTIIAKPLAKL